MVVAFHPQIESKVQVQTPTWHIYEIEEAAWTRSGMRTLEEWKEKLTIEDSPAAAELIDIEFENAITATQTVRDRATGSQLAYVFVLPNEVDFQFGFVLDAHSTGKTIILSPASLPWLEGKRIVGN